MENRILLLEDDVSLIDGLQYSLKKNGFDVDFVRSVQETLTYLSEMPPTQEQSVTTNPEAIIF